VQFLVSFFIYFWVFWVGHVKLLNQPVLRGFFYGIFWGATFAMLTLLATRSERMKRQQRQQAEGAEEHDAH
jgi:DMSO/TMAO reductase YedYZ heme-binding membrane subunit